MGKGIEVHFKLMSGPNIGTAMDALIARVEKAPSLKVTSFGNGSPSWYPYPVDAHLVFGKLEQTEFNRVYAENAVRAANGIGTFGAGWDFVGTFGSEVVGESAADGAAVVQQTAEAVAESAHGIGQGIGFGLVVLAVVAGYLYFKGPR